MVADRPAAATPAGVPEEVAPAAIVAAPIAAPIAAPVVAPDPAPQSAPRLSNWPVANGRISSYFGARLGGFHNGLDIAAPMYTPVRAAAAGVVQEAGQPYMSYGDTAGIIMIAHASNFSTLYAHLDVTAHPPIVKAGQRVAANEIIGFVGVTGWTTGPHVHFMTLYNQRQVDPLRFLP